MDVALLLVLVGSASGAGGMLDCVTFFLLLALWENHSLQSIFLRVKLPNKEETAANLASAASGSLSDLRSAEKLAVADSFKKYRNKMTGGMRESM